ncbi:MAG: HD domain-containing phosphohydrolase [Acidimicrobiia bacterium]|nr:HD domain-containing phosphohydrolase [Acidimicrobiia bacterium]
MELRGLLAVLDPTWVEHGHRVRHMAAELGKRLDLTESQLDRLEIAALLHDIGKSRLDPAVLALPRPLTTAEWEHVQEHPQIGFDLLTGNVHDDIAQAVLAHHERFDGSGYPHRLIGSDIPLAARILAVADAYDAITSDRVYDAARPASEAHAEITRGSGSQFDPMVVEAFNDVMASSLWAPTPSTRLSFGLAAR